MHSSLFASLIWLLGVAGPAGGVHSASGQLHLIPPTDARIRYVDRWDDQFPDRPRLWAAGGYLETRFVGPRCAVLVHDQQLYGQHNYLEIAVDDRPPYRIQTKGSEDTIWIRAGNRKETHRLLVCKDTETKIGYVAIRGFLARRLMAPLAAPDRKIECIGNSITCGMGSDLSRIACGAGSWYDQHNAYMSYGPTLARRFHAQWHLSAVSGIGLIHSCCNMRILMPEVYDKVDMADDSIPYRFGRYIPDVVTICLGQNDGIQDSAAFCGQYVRFLQRLRHLYPKARLVCCSSPMANPALNGELRRYLKGVRTYMRTRGDSQVYTYFYPHWYHAGCGGHPDMAQQQAMAGELGAFIGKIMHWRGEGT